MMMNMIMIMMSMIIKEDDDDDDAHASLAPSEFCRMSYVSPFFSCRHADWCVMAVITMAASSCSEPRLQETWDYVRYLDQDIAAA